ncbi:hypothetical protein EG346_15070 [Chryseobacterium carnipullorum]|uniref:Uncharacterized protein n=1 Tax=Chryseobacterium carnipullorum TaxID=1124835 RepID=A0A3G6N8K9_CHRCU|nr:hypothetical protein EG346_15070 [Chryseobacterium carnipullorum]AZA64311.1 hypothetical protein EG345_06025 [Chryseobacterium carnipullorum]
MKFIQSIIWNTLVHFRKLKIIQHKSTLKKKIKDFLKLMWTYFAPGYSLKLTYVFQSFVAFLV